MFILHAMFIFPPDSLFSLVLKDIFFFKYKQQETPMALKYLTHFLYVGSDKQTQKEEQFIYEIIPEINEWSNFPN